MAERGAPKRAVVVGFEYYARRLARLITLHSRSWSARSFGGGYLQKLQAMLALGSADALVSFGGPGPDGALIEIARARGIPVVVIWAGTDVVTAREDAGLLQTVRQYDFVHVTDGPWLVEELDRLGIRAEYVPVTSVDASGEPSDLPPAFRVLSYLPEPRRAFYGEEAVYAVARELADVPFTVVGCTARGSQPPPNVEFRGRVEHDRMQAIIDESSVLLRLPEHDGKSQLVLETLAHGRHVVWTYPFPGVRTVQTREEALDALRALRALHERGELSLNSEGRAYVRSQFEPGLLARRFEALLDDARAVPRPKRPRSRVVAISGVTLFSAQLAHDVRASSLDWEPRLLRSGRKNERLASLIALLGADVWYTIGSPIPDRLLHAAASLLRKPRVVHWVGSDILTIPDRSDVTRLCRRDDVLNLAEARWTIEELGAADVYATSAPLPPRVDAPAEPPPLPPYFTVLCYLPRVRGSFYGQEVYERLIATFARRPVRFLIVGGGTLRVADGADVVHLGWRADIHDVYAHSSVLVRFTPHDGLALMALEALAFGRYVLWTQPFEFTRLVRSPEDCERELSSLIGAHISGQLAPQAQVAREVQRQFSRSRCISTIAQAWERAIDRRIQSMRPAGANS